jgi:hypothetical protein
MIDNIEPLAAFIIFEFLLGSRISPRAAIRQIVRITTTALHLAKGGRR